MLDNAFGLAAGTGNNVVIARSVFSGNSGTGIEADAGAQVMVDSSVISNNAIGLQVGGLIRVGNSDIVFNGAAFSGALGTYGNNRILGNLGTPPNPAGGVTNDLGQQ